MATGKTPCGIAIPQTFARSPIDVQFLHTFLRTAETLGYESLWVQEQIIGDTSILEPITLLTYTAALTTKLRLGTSVILPAIRNPVQLAKSLSSLDQLSQGRLIVGVGFGGPHMQEAVFGFTGEQRSRRFVEGLNILKALWTQPKATVSGTFWNFTNVAMEPKPVQKPYPPLWFGDRYKNADMAVRVSLWGSLAECLDKLGELTRAGAQHLMLNPVFDEMEHLELLAQEVLPKL